MNVKIKLFPSFLGALSGFIIVAGIGQYNRATTIENKVTNQDLVHTIVNKQDITTTPDSTTVLSSIPIIKQVFPTSKRENFLQLVEQVNSKQGIFGIYIKNIDTKDNYNLNKNRVFFAASLYKVPVSVATYKAIENGTIELSDSVQYTPEDFWGGSGTIANNSYYRYYEISDVISRLLKHSDNSAQNMLMRTIPEELLKEAFLAYNDASGSQFYVDQEVNVENFSIYMENLYKNSINESNTTMYLEPKNASEILSIMEQTSFDDRINSGLPKEYTFAHKIGNWGDTGSWHDCGIALGKDTYVLCVMSENTTYEDFVEVSTLVGQFID